MIISFDIDGCITKYPAQFLFIGNGVRIAEAGELHFITARPETDRAVTVALLVELGFAHVQDTHAQCLHMYPDHYEWPWATEEETLANKLQHAAWKAVKCVELGVMLHYDDCEHNVEHVLRAGVAAFRVH